MPDLFASWFQSIEGTEAAGRAALILALISAAAHSGFSALQKWRNPDIWIIRGCIDFWYLVIAVPLALFVFPLPEAELAPILLGVFVIHSIYKIFLAAAYQRAAFTVVYPVVRGTAPLVTVLAAGVVFGETYRWGQWGGVALLSGAIMALALVNLRGITVGRATLLAALGFAVATGIMTALYTTYDAWGIRLAENPFSFLIWFFVVDGLLFPFIAAYRWPRVGRPPLRPLMIRGFVGGLIAFISFGGVMLATRLDSVGEAAALRETSVVFGALYGWLFLKERVGPIRAALMALISAGAVLVEFG